MDQNGSPPRKRPLDEMELVMKMRELRTALKDFPLALAVLDVPDFNLTKTNRATKERAFLLNVLAMLKVWSSPHAAVHVDFCNNVERIGIQLVTASARLDVEKARMDEEAARFKKQIDIKREN